MITAAAVRIGALGFCYYPQLDDYIQYGCYPNIAGIYTSLGLYRQRPLAGLFDIYVWGRMWEHMWLALVIITALHAASTYMLMRALRADLIFAAIFLLAPVNVEGSYWISASSRIIVPLFFLSLAAVCFSGGSRWFYFLFPISLLFYEQAAVLSFVLIFLLALRDKNYSRLWYLIFVGCLLFSYYISFSVIGGRGALGFDFGTLPAVIKSWSGKMTVNFKKISPLFCIAAVCSAVCFCADSGRGGRKRCWYGLLLFAIPYLPFFVLQAPTVGYRSCLVPLVGLAYTADCVAVRFRKIIAPLLAVFFIIVSGSDLCYYRESYLADRLLIREIAEKTELNMPNAVENVPKRNVNTGKDFAQYILAVTSSDWALTGAVREYIGKYDLPYYLMQSDETEGINIISP